MNWNHCRNNPGKWQTMQGTATKYDMKQGQYGDYALGDVTDSLGESVQVLFGSNDKSSLPGPQCVGHVAIWGGVYDANTQNYKVMFNGYAQGQQPAPQQTPPPQQAYQSPAPQTPQQAPPQARQARNAPQEARDATGVSIERQCIVKAVCQVAAGVNQGTGTMDIPQILDWCEALHYWVATGNKPGQGGQPNPNYDNNPQPTDDDIPF